MAPQIFDALYVIPNAIVPYAYETIAILGIPNGFIRRFRFREKWVSEQFKINYKDFINKPLFIILRDFETGSLIPLRSGTVENINKIGDTFFISYKQGPLVEYESNPPTREKQILSFNEQFFEYHRDKIAKNPNQHIKPLVFGTNFKFELINANYSATDYYEQDLERFENIISCIQSIDIFNGVQFLKIVDLTKMKDGIPADVKDCHYLLNEGVEYKLRIYQTAPTLLLYNMKEPNDISISSDSKYVNVIQGKKRAVGKYDVLSYIFRTTVNSAAAKTFIEVHFRTKHEDEPFIEPSFNIPVKIAVTINKFLINIFLLILFGIIYLCPQILRFSTIDALVLIKDVAIVGFAAAVIDLKIKLAELIKRT